jgi:hypothetical protein
MSERKTWVFTRRRKEALVSAQQEHVRLVAIGKEVEKRRKAGK